MIHTRINLKIIQQGEREINAEHVDHLALQLENHACKCENFIKTSKIIIQFIIKKVFFNFKCGDQVFTKNQGGELKLSGIAARNT